MLTALLLAATVLDENSLRKLLYGPPRVVNLPAATITVSSEIHVPDGFEIRGVPNYTTLTEAPSFRGRAILVCGSRVTIAGLRIEGKRWSYKTAVEIAPYDQSFFSYYDHNGIIADRVHDLTLRDLRIANVANFAIIISRGAGVTIERVSVAGSGSNNAKGRNNTSGGILLEEGTRNFTVQGCRIRSVTGNGIWTHSRYMSVRNGPGKIVNNDLQQIGRDAIQVGHATQVLIQGNTGRRIGWPVSAVDVEGGGTPVAIDTAGNVNATSYEDNRFEEINGKCLDLDGFHDGAVRKNVCINRGSAADYPYGHYGIVFNNTNPDMQSRNIRVEENTIDGARFGGIFVIGRGHTITGNRLLRLNLAHCNENPEIGCLYDRNQPDMLRSGMYLGARAERLDPAANNTITGNIIQGYGMDAHCIAAAPEVSLKSQTIGKNQCRK